MRKQKKPPLRCVTLPEWADGRFSRTSLNNEMRNQLPERSDMADVARLAFCSCTEFS
jgi:hypothetical protein